MKCSDELEQFLSNNPKLVISMYGKALSMLLRENEGICVKLNNTIPMIGIIHVLRDDGTHGFEIGEVKEEEARKLNPDAKEIKEGTLFFVTDD